MNLLVNIFQQLIENFEVCFFFVIFVFLNYIIVINLVRLIWWYLVICFDFWVCEVRLSNILIYYFQGRCFVVVNVKGLENI